MQPYYSLNTSNGVTLHNTLYFLQETILINKCLNNDRKAQFEFYQQYFAFISGICLRYLPDAPAAREITNDVFLKIFKKLSLYDAAKGSLLAWMKMIAVNTCLDKLKLKQFEAHHVAIEEEHNALADTVKEHQLGAEDLMAFLKMLPEKQAVIFNLFVVEGYSHEEIGSLLNISSGNSRWYLADARQRLKKLITASGYLVK